MKADTSSALTVLKKVNKYTQDNASCDPVLLALSHNNLSALYLSKQQHEKAFKFGLTAYESIKKHLHLMKGKKDPSTHQNVTILVNSCFLLQACLGMMLGMEKCEDGQG